MSKKTNKESAFEAVTQSKENTVRKGEQSTSPDHVKNTVLQSTTIADLLSVEEQEALRKQATATAPEMEVPSAEDVDESPYGFLNKSRTMGIYSLLEDMDALYSSDPYQYCTKGRFLAERILKYLLSCCNIEPLKMAGENFDLLKGALPDSILDEEIINEWHVLLCTTNRYHHDDDRSLLEPYHDSYTILKTLEYIIPWLEGIEEKIRLHMENVRLQMEKEREMKEKRWKKWGIGLLALIGVVIVIASQTGKKAS